MWLSVLFSFTPALYLWLAYGLIPSGAVIMKGFGLIFAVVGVFYFVEPISYFPVLGIPGTYLSFLAGNISNLRLPCAAVAQEAADVKEGTSKGAIIATIAIAVSMLVNTTIIFIGAAGVAALVKYFPPFVLTAFRYILPAIFGAIFGQFFLRSYLLESIALGISLVALLVKVIPAWGVLLIAVFGTIAIARILWQRGMIGGKKNEEVKK